MNKICYKCKIEKSSELFRKNKSKKDGLNSYCKDCYKYYEKNWSLKNKDKLIKKEFN